MDRTVSRPRRIRGSGTLLACAAAAALVITGCSGAPDGDDPAGGDEVADPTPEPVRFESLPNACRTVTEDTIAEVVPEAGNAGGEELTSDDVNATSTCLWSGLDGYDFRSLTITLKRFDSDLALGSGDERATQYLLAQTSEVTENDANEALNENDLADVGDEAVTLGYAAEKESGDTTRDFQQQRVAARIGNVVVTVDYAGAGFEDADTPSAEDIQEAAEQIAGESVTAVAATEGDDAADEDGDS